MERVEGCVEWKGMERELTRRISKGQQREREKGKTVGGAGKEGKGERLTRKNGKGTEREGMKGIVCAWVVWFTIHFHLIKECHFLLFYNDFHIQEW